MSESIELDCAPGMVRPWQLIAGVIEGTILEGKADTSPGHTFFGARAWYFDIDRETWEKEVQPIIMPRIKALYESGLIRYGSW